MYVLLSLSFPSWIRWSHYLMHILNQLWGHSSKCESLGNLTCDSTQLFYFKYTCQNRKTKNFNKCFLLTFLCHTNLIGVTYLNMLLRYAFHHFRKIRGKFIVQLAASPITQWNKIVTLLRRKLPDIWTERESLKLWSGCTLDFSAFEFSNTDLSNWKFTKH